MYDEEFDVYQKIVEHDCILQQQGKQIEELTTNVMDLRELINKIDKLVVRVDVTIKMIEKAIWGGVGAILVFVLDQLLGLL